VYHGKGNANIEHSARFLLAYADTLNSNVLATSEPVVTDLNGKKPLIKMHSQVAASSDGDKKPRRRESPPSDWLKVNIDGSFTPADGKGATGVVIRNSLGETIAAMGSVLEKCNSAEEAEVMALLHGAQLAKEQTIAPIIFESDCVRIAQNPDISLSHLRGIFHEFRVSASSLI
jgi:hypothetical protein